MMSHLHRFAHSPRVRRLWLPIAGHTGLLKRMQRRLTDALTILTYHRVLPDEEAVRYPFASLAVPLSAFTKQVHWLKRQWTMLPLGEAVCQLSRGPVPEPLLSITFDDGYRDNIELAAPVLDAAGVHATFFITAGAVREGQTLWFDRAYDAAHAAGMRDPLACVRALKAMPPGEREERIAALGGATVTNAGGPMMTPDQVRQLAAGGHEIGSHTMSHPIMTHLAPEELTRELVESRSLLQQWTGQRVRGLCYPNGDHDRTVLTASRAAGYQYACSTQVGRNRIPLDVLALRRVHVDPRRVLRARVHDERAFMAELCFAESQ